MSDKNWLNRRIAAEAVATVDLDHVVLVYDPECGELSTYGPFPDPVSACAFADRLTDEMNEPDMKTPRFTVSALQQPDH